MLCFFVILFPITIFFWDAKLDEDQQIPLIFDKLTRSYKLEGKIVPHTVHMILHKHLFHSQLKVPENYLYHQQNILASTLSSSHVR